MKERNCSLSQTSHSANMLEAKISHPSSIVAYSLLELFVNHFFFITAYANRSKGYKGRIIKTASLDILCFNQP